MKLTKRISILLLALIFAVMTAVSASAAALDLSLNDEGVYEEDGENVYDISVPGHVTVKGSLEQGFSFGVKFNFMDHGWIDINFYGENRLPEKDRGYLGNKALTMILWASNGNVTPRLVTEETGWDNPYAAFEGSVDTVDYFGDEKWHKVEIKKADGKWSLKVDGVEFLAEVNDETTAVLDQYLGGAVGYVSFGSDSGQGNYFITDGETVDALIAAQAAEETTTAEVTTKEEVTTAGETTKTETEKTDVTTAADTEADGTDADKDGDDGDDGDSNLIIYIIAGVVIVAAIVVIAVVLAKKKKK